MISTNWIKGNDNINEALKLRNKIFIEEMNLPNYGLSDIYDDFSFNVVAYNDDEPVGTGRLLFKDGKYFIDNVCVVKEFRRKHFGDLIVRMLVRRAVNMGAEKTYAEANEDSKLLFESVGFQLVNFSKGIYLMVKTGDVSGHCTHWEINEQKFNNNNQSLKIKNIEGR